jgi:hypothetical protein
MNDFLKELIQQFGGQLLALITFFLFPALQYVLLKRSSHKDGTPELWYLPKYGFRLVIRNIPRNRTLSDIKQRTYLRKVVPASPGTSVATYLESIIVTQEELFLFPGNDLLLICFRIEGDKADSLDLVVTDKLGNEKSRHPLSSFDRLVSDYTANIENRLNFDVKLGKQAQLYMSDMVQIWKEITKSNLERRFELSRIKSVG